MVAGEEEDGIRFFFFFKQKTAYEILTCDWSSDVCSSDLSIVPHLFETEAIISGSNPYGDGGCSVETSV